ncbi:hypothetical protein ACHAWF_011315 [Thalassiosira exigua]
MLPSSFVHNVARGGGLLRKRSSAATPSLPSPSRPRRDCRLVDRVLSASPTPPDSSDEFLAKIRSALEISVPALVRKRYFGGSKSNLDLLATLNGYRRINVGHPHRISLAEGVVAEGSEDIAKNMTIYAKPSGGSFADPHRQHPPFVAEDYALFSLMEQRIEEKFNRVEDRVMDWYWGKRDYLKKKVKTVQDTLATLPVKKLVRRSGSETQSNDDISCNYSRDSILFEDVLVVTKEGRVVSICDVPSDCKLLALPRLTSFEPFRLRKSRSGTVLYNGIVLFGAMPLTYRSLMYAIDYPALAKALVASVFGSIAYSVWSQREAARTRQSLIVAAATLSRYSARDEAAVNILIDGASQDIIDAVIKYYHSMLNGTDDDAKRFMSQSTLIDTRELALELGLLSRRGSEIMATEPRAVINDVAKKTFELQAANSSSVLSRD